MTLNVRIWQRRNDKRTRRPSTTRIDEYLVKIRDLLNTSSYMCSTDCLKTSFENYCPRDSDRRFEHEESVPKTCAESSNGRLENSMLFEKI